MMVMLRSLLARWRPGYPGREYADVIENGGGALAQGHKVGGIGPDLARAEAAFLYVGYCAKLPA
jgi:hypothetical protein